MKYVQLTGLDTSSFRRWVEAVLISAAATATIGGISLVIGMVLNFLTPHKIQLEYDYESGYPEVCSGRDEGVAFEVTFQGSHEQGVVIQQSKDRVEVMTFNNYYGMEIVEAYWMRGEGRHEVLPNKKGICYHVIGYHKETPPNPGANWIASHMQFGSDRTSVTFAPRRDLFLVGTHVKVTRCKTDEESQDEVLCKDVE